MRRFAIFSDTDSIGSPGDLEGDVDGSFASGDEEAFEVPAGRFRLDDCNLEELVSKILVGAWQQSWCQTDFGQTDFGQLCNRFWPNMLFQCFGQIFSTHKTQTPQTQKT